MNEKQEGTRSQMFTLRVWVEDVGDGRIEYRGTIKHILTGETHHFRDWAALTQLIKASMTAAPKIQTN
ncbi:MAG: hypothetical protein GY805_32055 [Chloroflexi bacterium]|nr:hypothetical protein [Chloroflexota bacterium]